MNARSRALLEELRSLPVEEREAVVAELYEGTERELDAEAWDPVWIAELERRLQESKAGLTPSISREDARAHIEAALRARR